MTRKSDKDGRGRTGERSGRSRPVAELVPAIGQKAFRRFGFVEGAMIARWAEIVGPEYAENVVPESLRFPHGQRSAGTLTLLASGAHALMLQHVVPQVVERVNRFFGYDAVARIAIRQGSVPPPARQRAQAPELAVPAEAAASLKAIRDDGLRASLEDLARQIAATSGPPTIR